MYLGWRKDAWNRFTLFSYIITKNAPAKIQMLNNKKYVVFFKTQQERVKTSCTSASLAYQLFHMGKFMCFNNSLWPEKNVWINASKVPSKVNEGRAGCSLIAVFNTSFAFQWNPQERHWAWNNHDGSWAFGLKILLPSVRRQWRGKCVVHTRHRA